MRKLSLLAAAGLLAVAMTAKAESLDDILASNGVLATSSAAPAKLSYADGVKIEAPDAGFDMKINLLIQATASYTDYENASERGLNDKTSFDIPRARLIFGGNLLNGEVSYFLQADFVGNQNDATDDNTDDTGDTSELKDAWLRWNWNKDIGLQMGQFKVPFGRQELVNDHLLQFISRSQASDDFTPGRDRGSMISGKTGDIGYALGVFNGQSDGENFNTAGVDPDLQGGGQVYFSSSNYGSRKSEGDYEQTEGVGFTAGVSSDVMQGTNDGDDFTLVEVAGDAGLRSEGLSLQAEYFWASYDPDGGDNSNNTGYYAQAGYMVVPKEWEVAGRFSGVNPDSDGSPLGSNDQYQYALAINRFYNGPNLKLTLQATFDQTDGNGEEEDTLDQVYEAQVSGYF